MQNRVSNILGSSAIGLSWLGTFHSICAKLQKTCVNCRNSTTIIDTDDQIRLIKNICKAENIDIKQLSPKFILLLLIDGKKGFYPSGNHKKDIYEKQYLFTKFINKN